VSGGASVEARLPGSIAGALYALEQGAQSCACTTSRKPVSGRDVASYVGRSLDQPPRNERHALHAAIIAASAA